MALTDRYLLPADLVLVPVADLPTDLRARIEHDANDVALTRPRIRMPSSIVDADTASLLNRFRVPTRVVDAVILHAAASGVDPQALLEQVFPAIEKLILGRLLVPEDAADATGVMSALWPNRRIGRFTVLRQIQLLDDTELHLARDESGGFAAVKVLRSGADPGLRELFDAEREILRYLDGHVGPPLLAEGIIEEGAFLITEWCPGVPVTRASAEWRADDAHGRARLAELCLAVLDAYARLHEVGVLHGDVHPRNVLVTRVGGVRLIDFGMARGPASITPPDSRDPYRGGVAFFYEPEYAAARLTGRRPPATTPLGEQYSVAALLWLLLTGVHYLDFSLQRDPMLRQIAETEPRPVTGPWSALDPTLRRALAKDPRDRFDDIASLRANLARQMSASGWQPSPYETSDDAPVEVRRPGVPAMTPKRAESTGSLVSEIVSRYGTGGSLLETGMPTSPRASASHGAAGVAVTLLRLAVAREDPGLLAAADIWTTHAARHAEEGKSAFVNAELELLPETIGSVSPFHTASGVYLVAALVAAVRGDTVSSAEAIDGYCEAAGATERADDLTLGQSGALLGAALLRPMAPDSGVLSHFGTSALSRVADRLARPGPVASGNLGMAHGVAGMAYAVLRWCQASGDAVPDAVQARLEELLGQAEPWQRGMRWPIRPPQLRLADHAPKFLTGWCHGSAGYTHLWCLAAAVLKDERFASFAEQSAWATWDEPSGSGSLCCGLSGQAYALLAAARSTGDAVWIRRAQNFAAHAASSATEYEHSLWKGPLGIAVLLAELESPRDARMPIFEPEAWAAQATENAEWRT